MKRVLARGLVFVVSGLSVLSVPASASADEAPSAAAPTSESTARPVPRRDALSPVEERRIGEIQRGIGIGTTVAGMAVATAATTYMFVGLGTGQGQGSLAALGPVVVGSAGAGLGFLLSALGVPLWVAGQVRIARAKESERVSLLPSFTPLAGGGVATLTVGF
jgi:hypothetical protein